MPEQTDIFGRTVLHITDVKQWTNRVLCLMPELSECEFAWVVATEIVKRVGIDPIRAESEDTIVLQRSAFYWIVENIPSIERYIREFKADEAKRSRGCHVTIKPSLDNF